LDAFIDGIEVLGGLITMASRGEEHGPASEHADGLTQHIELLLGQSGTARRGDPLKELALDPAVLHVLTEYEEHRLRENIKKGVTLYKVRAIFKLDDFDVKLAAMSGALKPIGEVISTLPSSQVSDEASIGFDLIVGCSKTLVELQAVLVPFGAEASLLSASVAPPPRASAP